MNSFYRFDDMKSSVNKFKCSYFNSRSVVLCHAVTKSLMYPSLSLWSLCRGHFLIESVTALSIYLPTYAHSLHIWLFMCVGGGGAVAQSVELAAPGEEVPGSISTVAARSLLVGSVSVKCDQLRQKSWSPRSFSCVAGRKIFRRSVLGPVRDIALLLTATV